MELYIVLVHEEKELKSTEVFKDLTDAQNDALDKANSYGKEFWNAYSGEYHCYVETIRDAFTVEIVPTKLK